MNQAQRSAVLALWCSLVIAPLALAQPNPRIGYVYPAGGRQGARLDLTLGGKQLDGVSEVYVSGTGVKGTIIGHVKPKNPPTPAIAEMVTLELSVAVNAAAGQRELRLRTPSGLTNPLPFFVGPLPEFQEKAGTSSQGEQSVSLPSIINGQILPGEVDRFRFQAKKGQRVVAVASARELVPYLPDAVPGWFQAVLALYDLEGNELAYADDFYFHPDPVIYCQIPKDGTYIIEIRDSIHRGREDFVYRIALGELPFITNVFPLGGKAGGPTRVELKGWNLPVAELSPSFVEPGIQPLSVFRRDRALSERKLDLLLGEVSSTRADAVSRTESTSNFVPFAVDTLPECLEREPNDSRESPQPVKLPIIVNGRIDRPGDWDVFRFEGRAGDQVVAEVTARRLNSPLDSFLKLTDAAGRQLAFNDDHLDRGAGLVTHHADSFLRVTLPSTGAYDLHLGDAQHSGGREYAYRLRISPPRPDFELRIVPSSINVRGGATVPLWIYVLRKDGFAGEIKLSLKQAPSGMVLGGATVPDGQDQVRITATAPPVSRKEPLSLSLEGRARIAGREVVRPVVPAEDMMQAFAYHHLVPTRELKLSIWERAGSRPPVTILGDTPVKIPAGGSARLKIAVSATGQSGETQLELDAPPEGISLRNEPRGSEGPAVVLEADKAKVKPGMKGNFIFQAVLLTKQAAAKQKPATVRRTPLGILPATPFEIVGK